MANPNPSAGQQGSGQLNKRLGANTVAFHQQYPLPKLQGTGRLPDPGAITSSGGTPNQKAERLANRIALHHFVHPDAGQAAAAVTDTIGFFQGQFKTGHQCIANADEAFTPSHAPIWWRAITSLRITTSVLADRGGDHATLAACVLDWIQFHTSLNALGEIPSGPNAHKVLLPGSRWKSDTAVPGNPGKACGRFTPNGDQGGGYPKDPLTDQVNNIVHQLITTGKVPWNVAGRIFTLRPEAPDLAGVALAKQIVDSGVGFGDAKTSKLPRLRSKLVVRRFSNGHRATFPDGMPCAKNAALDAWTDYTTGEMCMSYTVGGCAEPAFEGNPTEKVVEAVAPVRGPRPRSIRETFRQEVPMAGVGEALFTLGFTRTAWLDQTTGRQKTGAFNPSATDPSARYGSPGLNVRGWLPENYTGAHSTGQNSEAIRLAPIVLKATASPQLDQTDLNFVNGGTQHVLNLAREMGLLGDPADPHDHENVLVLKAALDELDRQVAAQKQSVPATGGGKWVSALRGFIRSLEDLSKTTRAKLK